MPNVYVASKLCHAEMWRKLRIEWRTRTIEINSRWIDLAHWETPGNTLLPVDAAVLWQLDVEDVMNADALVVYAAPGDTLRGALVETGIALIANKFIVAVGVDGDDNFGTWQYHPSIRRVSTLDHALQLLTMRFATSLLVKE